MFVCFVAAEMAAQTCARVEAEILVCPLRPNRALRGFVLSIHESLLPSKSGSVWRPSVNRKTHLTKMNIMSKMKKTKAQ